MSKESRFWFLVSGCGCGGIILCGINGRVGCLCDSFDIIYSIYTDVDASQSHAINFSPKKSVFFVCHEERVRYE